MIIKYLYSGGVISNYYCTSTCRHCLYACSPKWKKQYITPYIAVELFKKMKLMGCFSVHIGGGEPFLDTKKLINLLRVARNEGIGIDYIETNSSWFKDHQQAIYILKEIRLLGVSTLLVSISPFHNEFIPFYKVKGVINSCNTTGIRVFPWIQDFYHDIDKMDDTVVHTQKDFTDLFDENYLKKIPSRYWINPGGRAIGFYREHFSLQPLAKIINNKQGCNELVDTSHFHLDLFGNYIPGLCSGLAIRYKDVGKAISDKQYSLISILYNKGIAGLLEVAQRDFEFTPDNMYFSKCDLCLAIRKHIVKTGYKSKELQPVAFYEQL